MSMVGELPLKHSILGIDVSATRYREVASAVVDAAVAGEPLSVTACAVHGLMEGHLDPAFSAALNSFDIVAPDGQPVRWALNLLHHCQLTDRVYGPNLVLEVCRLAAEHGLSVFFVGSTPATLDALTHNLRRMFPSLVVAGTQPSRFRAATVAERDADVDAIRGSGARICFVGLGCPRQEWWVFHLRERVSMPALAVGAAFDFHAGTLAQAPAWMQNAGLEWAFRLLMEPRRLWRRYLRLNPLFVTRVAQQYRTPTRFAARDDLTAARRHPCPS